MSARRRHGDGDEGIAQMLEAAADEIAREPQPDWAAIGGLVSQVKRGALSAGEALFRATKVVPSDRQDVLDDLRKELGEASKQRAS